MQFDKPCTFKQNWPENEKTEAIMHVQIIHAPPIWNRILPLNVLKILHFLRFMKQIIYIFQIKLVALTEA